MWRAVKAGTAWGTAGGSGCGCGEREGTGKGFVVVVAIVGVVVAVAVAKGGVEAVFRPARALATLKLETLRYFALSTRRGSDVRWPEFWWRAVLSSGR